MNKYDVVKFDGINPNLIYAPNNLHIRMTRGERRIADELNKQFGRFERVVIDVDGEQHEFSADSLIRLLESYEGASRWHELFGTPERAARTLAKACGECDDNLPCDECPLAPIIDFNVYELNLLEWLRGDAK